MKAKKVVLTELLIDHNRIPAGELNFMKVIGRNNDDRLYCSYCHYIFGPLDLSQRECESGYCMITSDQLGRLQVELLNNIEEIPLDILRELNDYVSGLPETLNVVAYDSNTSIWDFGTHPLITLFKFDDSFSIRFPERCLNAPDFISGSPSYELGTITFQKTRNFIHSQEYAPPPTLNATVTYIAEGDYCVVYGGLIATENITRETYNEALIQLETSTEFHDTPKEQIRKTLNFCLHMSDAVWKYYLADNTWKLALPASQPNKEWGFEQWSRPRGRRMIAVHHLKRKKIYYLCEDFKSKTYNSLFEYDYTANDFSRIELRCTTLPQIIDSWVIDYSNDTLLLSVRSVCDYGILIFCFQTHKSVYLELEGFPIEYSPPKRKIGLVDNFNKLIFLSRIFTKKGVDKIAYVEWGNYKRKTLNALLKKTK